MFSNAGCIVFGEEWTTQKYIAESECAETNNNDGVWLHTRNGYGSATEEDMDASLVRGHEYCDRIGRF